MSTEMKNKSFFARNTNPCLKRVEPYIPGPTAASVSAKYGIPIEKLIKMSSNENPLGPSPRVRATLKQIADGNELHRYPTPVVLKLRTAVAKSIGLNPEQILPGAGSSETWGLIIRAFSLPGDEILWVHPSVVSYGEDAVLCERTSRKVVMSFPFELTADLVLGGVTGKTRVIFLSSPNNTTSRFVDGTTIEKIAREASNAVVVADEHYIEAANNYRERTAIQFLKKVPNLIVTRTFSKLYGLAGMRIGYAAGPTEAIEVLFKFKPPWNVSVAAEAVGLAALEDSEHLEKSIRTTREGREYLVKELSKNPGLQLVPDAQGVNVLFRTKNRDSKEVTEDLFKKGIMVRSDLLDGYIRLSVGTREQNECVVSALKALLDPGLNKGSEK